MASPMIKRILFSSLPPWTRSVVAATRGQMPTATSSVGQNFTSRRSHWASDEAAITNLVAVDINWYIGASKIPTATGNSLTLKKYIEYPVDVFHQVTWGGLGTVTIASAQQAVSDTILSSITGRPLVIAKGDKFWERTTKTSAASQVIPVIEMPANMDTLGLDDGGTTSDRGNNGTIAPSASLNTWGSVGIRGDIATLNARSFALFTDSIGFGTGDVSSVDARGNSGWIARGVGIKYPYFKVSKPGMMAFDLANNASSAWTSLFAALGVTDAIFEHGIVDLGNGKTVAETLASHQSNYGRYGAGVRKYQTTITPSSNSTDGWATVINQTPDTTTGNEADIPVLNAAIRALPKGLTGIIEGADFAMSAHDSGVWGGPFPPTLDGTHPTTAKHVAMAALMQAAGTPV